MRLTRSDSAQSTWDLHLPRDGEDDSLRDQRRIRHLSAVLVRNLSLEPRRDEISAALFGQPQPDLVPTSGPSPRVQFGDLGTDAVFANPTKRLIGRSRAGSAASWSGVPDSMREELVLGDEGADASRRAPVRTRPRRSSSAGTLLAHPSARIDEEPAPPADDPSQPSASAAASLRARSASRASIASAGSSSTIRQAPRIPPPLRKNERPPLPSAAQFAHKEKQRREDALRRRLVDSFVSLELVAAVEGTVPDPLDLAGRNRSRSFATTRMQRSGSAGSIHGVSSPRKAMRRRTTSTSLMSSSTSVPNFASASASAARDPFFVSPPSLASMHAAFSVDSSSFLVASDAGAPALPGDPATTSWPGLRESRLRARVFARPSDALGAAATSAKGKEKERVEEDWRCLIEWDVELDGLTSLGRDPTAFPSLPPNTLVFALSPSAPAFSSTSPSAASSAAPSDIEYFTAPLSLLHRSSTRRARRTHVGRTLSLSEDEADPGGSGSGSGSDEGNLSDPGIGTAAVPGRARSRSGTLVLRREEERRRRLAIVERSRRETRMVRGAAWAEVRRLWEGEREVELLGWERDELRRRVGEALGGVEGWAELERERAESQDRVDDLKGVKEAVDQELADDEAGLRDRREALHARRDRLERAKALDRENREQVDAQRELLDKQAVALAKLVLESRTRRTQLITLLSHIFPIDPVELSASDKTPPHLLFSIVGLALPNSSYPSSYSDDHLSSALGYAAQVSHLLAAYLGVPLCYPLRCRASRSVVVDEISMMKGPRAFPLYGRGVDRYRFDYAVFLLNKNIEQLMYSQGLTVLDLRNTLPNLKTLILSLSYDPSHADYRSATLLPAGLFATGAGEDPAPAPDDAEPDAAEGEPQPLTATRMSRSSSLASTIRAPRRRASGDSSRSRSSGRNGAEGGSPPPSSPTARESNGGITAPEDESVIEEEPAAAGGRTPLPMRNGDATPVARGAEKRHVPPSAVHSVPSGNGPASLKVRVAKPSGGAGGGGYGAMIREGLWSAVAGNVAAGGGGGREGTGEGKGESRLGN